MTAFSYTYIRPPNRAHTYQADLLEATSDLIILRAPLMPSRPVEIGGVIVLDRGYLATWFLFNGYPYDVARVERPDGSLTGFYADALEPVHWEGADPFTLQPITDLFLDLWIAPDGQMTVLDVDELSAAIRSGAVTAEQAETARSAIAELQTEVQAGRFPPPAVRTFSCP